MFEINSEPHEMLANILPRGTPYKKIIFLVKVLAQCLEWF